MLPNATICDVLPVFITDNDIISTLSGKSLLLKTTYA